METPVEVVYQGMSAVPGLEARIRKEVAKLERYHERITACRVVVETPHRHKRKGKLFEVRIHLTLPGGRDVAVGRGATKDRAREDLYVALREAFDAARRQLKDDIRRQRGQVKIHETPPHGHVTKLFVEQDYGFLESSDGREVYFHRNAVVDDKFATLEVGSEVRFAETMGDKGAQASTVHVIGKHHVT